MSLLTSVSPPSPATAQFYRLCATVLSLSQRRHASTSKRNRKRLQVKPDPAFLPSKTEAHDHIIHNPPPSMPNVYHTPAIFLPKDDPRRTLQAPATKSLLANTPTYTPSGKARLPPPVRTPYQKRYHLTEAQLDEMRRLRAEDPLTWSMKQLAKKFDCSVVFAMMVTQGIAPGKKALQDQVTEIVKSRWGPKRRVAREDRTLRREQWYKDS